MRAMSLGVLVAMVGCNTNTPTYFQPMTAIEVGQPGSMATSASVVVSPTFRPPTDAERKKLDEDSRTRTYRVPWIRRSDVALSVQYTLTNLSAEPARVRVEVNGASELASYDPDVLRAAAVMANPKDDDVVVLPLIQMPVVTLAPGEVKSGLVREDDFAEAALDLDALGRFMAVPESVLVNRSEVNPIGLERVPPDVITPQLVQVKVSLIANRHVRAELLLRVRDNNNVLAPTDSTDLYRPMPRAYVPPAPMMAKP